MATDTIASIEQGRRLLKQDQAELLDRILDTKGLLAAALDHMPDAAMTPLWTQQLFDLDKDAATVSSYENQVVPGLLQTEAYTRAVFSNRLPPTTMTSRRCIQRSGKTVRDCCNRKHRRPSASFVSFVVWEPVLHLRLCTDAEHKQHIWHLRAMADLPGLIRTPQGPC
ncbi:hypothetical protein GCM10023082_35640 [Streptomyces tremellae]|uniref:DUF5753 domain-containing protein n=2 Tax=Streptomyces tremellae TaxID=1124239 RepID=A0ABP7FCV9_9ACTN